MRHLDEKKECQPCALLAPGFHILMYLSKYSSSFSGLTRESRVMCGKAILEVVSMIQAGLDPRVKPEDDEKKTDLNEDDVTALIQIA